ncbi:hypothetical protein TNCV_3097011 [Trichonephila clavipes]|uniref:Uncharacterized protein n=1 Tax=Trichonephila clavipes TaxID=2585209 RepID=A0A8X6SNB5_TRICX|nr:hypothetical protein TNCV_3097011 [Trichonephila clavipes]
MQGRKCRSCERWCRENEQKRISRRENILLKSCTATGFEITKSSGVPDSGAAWNFLRFGRFLACHVSSRQLQTFKRYGFQLKERAFRSPNSFCEPRRSPCTFEHLFESATFQ